MVEPGDARLYSPIRRRSVLHGTTLVALILSGSWGHARADEVATPTALEDITQQAEITLELIMSDPDWIGRPPENPYWADDGTAIYFEQKRAGEEQKDLFRLELANGEPVMVADEARGRVDAPAGVFSQDRRFKTYSRHGDVYVKDLARGELIQLTRTAEPENDPFFMAGGSARPRVAFTRGDQVFVRDLETGL